MRDEFDPVSSFRSHLSSFLLSLLPHADLSRVSADTSRKASHHSREITMV